MGHPEPSAVVTVGQYQELHYLITHVPELSVPPKVEKVFSQIYLRRNSYLLHQLPWIREGGRLAWELLFQFA
jgi:hypothetical protein